MLEINYASSDEEDAAPAAQPKTDPPEPPTIPTIPQDTPTGDLPSSPLPRPTRPPPDEPAAAPPPPETPPQSTSTIGPALGPAAGPAAPPSAIDASELPSASASPPASPYTSTRAALRNLTMPPVPNFSIPDSPPGSPPPGPSAKVSRFLALKKQGVHFNAKLGNSSALRNPALLTKLRGFAGISDEDQYASTLPEAVAVPTQWPEWAYWEELNRTQKQVLKKREEEQKRKGRTQVDFVPAASASAGTPTAGSEAGGEAGTRAGGSRWDRRELPARGERSRSPRR